MLLKARCQEVSFEWFERLMDGEPIATGCCTIYSYMMARKPTRGQKFWKVKWAGHTWKMSVSITRKRPLKSNVSSEMFCPLVQIERVRWSVRLRIIVLLVFIFNQFYLYFQIHSMRNVIEKVRKGISDRVQILRTPLWTQNSFEIFPRCRRWRSTVNIVGTWRSKTESSRFLPIKSGRCSLTRSRMTLVNLFTTSGSTQTPT